MSLSTNKTMLLTALVAALLAASLPAASGVKTASCRQQRDITSLCVGQPLLKRNLPGSLRAGVGKRFCPYHICGPSHVASEDCPTDGAPSATARCLRQKLTRRVWLCRKTVDRVRKRSIPFPFGCEGGACTAEREVCSCYKRRVTTIRYTHIVDYTPFCGPQ